MTATVFLAVLLAALIHASWNAVIKTGADRYQAMLLLTLTQGVMALAMVFWFPIPAREAWPWLLGSGIFHTFYKLFLSAAYHRGDFTCHFNHLHLRKNDREALVRAAIDGSDNNPQNRVVAVLIIVFRYRNNLFHGVKWQYNLEGQLDNFIAANAVLMKVLEKHGALAEG